MNFGACAGFGFEGLTVEICEVPAFALVGTVWVGGPSITGAVFVGKIGVVTVFTPTKD